MAALAQQDSAEVRGLVERVTLSPEGDGQRVEVRGELAAILALAQGAKRAGRAGADAGCAAVLCAQVEMVAGTRSCLYRTRFRAHLPRHLGQETSLIFR